MNNGFFSSLAESLSDTLFGGQDPFHLATRNAASASRNVLPKESAKGPRGCVYPVLIYFTKNAS